MMIIDLNTDYEETEEIQSSNTSSSSNSNELKKSCVDCHTTRTPCWRVGPAGPKTLCNACGIRYRKKRRDVLGLDKRGKDANKKKIGKSGRNRSSSKVMVSGTGREMLFQEPWKNKLGEEEQAAFLLMALSYGCVSA